MTFEHYQESRCHGSKKRRCFKQESPARCGKCCQRAARQRQHPKRVIWMWYHGDTGQALRGGAAKSGWVKFEQEVRKGSLLFWKVWPKQGAQKQSDIWKGSHMGGSRKFRHLIFCLKYLQIRFNVSILFLLPGIPLLANSVRSRLKAPILCQTFFPGPARCLSSQMSISTPCCAQGPP